MTSPDELSDAELETTFPDLDSLKPFSKIKDNRFGLVSLYQQGEEKVASKTRLYKSREEFKGAISRMKKQVRNSHPNLQRVLGYSSSITKSFCFPSYVLTSFHQFPTKTVDALRETALKSQVRIRSAQLLEIAVEALIGLAFLHSQGGAIGDLRASSLGFDGEGRLFVMDPALTNSARAEAMKGVSGTGPYFVSPAVYESLCTGKDSSGRQKDWRHISVSAELKRSDVFALGMVLLTLGGTREVSGCYAPRGRFDSFEMVKLFNEFEGCHGGQGRVLTEMVLRMLETDEERRQTPREILGFFLAQSAKTPTISRLASLDLEFLKGAGDVFSLDLRLIEQKHRESVEIEHDEEPSVKIFTPFFEKESLLLQNQNPYTSVVSQNESSLLKHTSTTKSLRASVLVSQAHRRVGESSADFPLKQRAISSQISSTAGLVPYDPITTFPAIMTSQKTPVKLPDTQRPEELRTPVRCEQGGNINPLSLISAIRQTGSKPRPLGGRPTGETIPVQGKFVFGLQQPNPVEQVTSSNAPIMNSQIEPPAFQPSKPAELFTPSKPFRGNLRVEPTAVFSAEKLMVVPPASRNSNFFAEGPVFSDSGPSAERPSNFFKEKTNLVRILTSDPQIYHSNLPAPNYARLDTYRPQQTTLATSTAPLMSSELPSHHRSISQPLYSPLPSASLPQASLPQTQLNLASLPSASRPAGSPFNSSRVTPGIEDTIHRSPRPQNNPPAFNSSSVNPFYSSIQTPVKYGQPPGYLTQSVPAQRTITPTKQLFAPAAVPSHTETVQALIRPPKAIKPIASNPKLVQNFRNFMSSTQPEPGIYGEVVNSMKNAVGVKIFKDSPVKHLRTISLDVAPSNQIHSSLPPIEFSHVAQNAARAQVESRPIPLHQSQVVLANHSPYKPQAPVLLQQSQINHLNSSQFNENIHPLQRSQVNQIIPAQFREQISVPLQQSQLFQSNHSQMREQTHPMQKSQVTQVIQSQFRELNSAALQNSHLIQPNHSQIRETNPGFLQQSHVFPANTSQVLYRSVVHEPQNFPSSQNNVLPTSDNKFRGHVRAISLPVSEFRHEPSPSFSSPTKFTSQNLPNLLANSIMVHQDPTNARQKEPQTSTPYLAHSFLRHTNLIESSYRPSNTASQVLFKERDSSERDKIFTSSVLPSITNSQHLYGSRITLNQAEKSMKNTATSSCMFVNADFSHIHRSQPSNENSTPNFRSR